MKKITITLVLFSINSFAFYNSNSQYEAQLEKGNTAYQEVMLIRCVENATEYSNLTGKELDKTTSYALSKCQDILRNYKLIPEGMMPFEEEIKELKKKKEIKEKNYYQNNINKGSMKSEELDWEKE